MSDVKELRRRREALEAQLSALTAQREHAFRANSDALALQQAGVTHHDQAEMKQLADAEIAGDSTMTDLRGQIARIDDELERDHGRGFAGRRRTIMRWLRR
jgi:transposase